MRLGTALTTAVTGVQASARVLEVSSHNTANAVTDGFVPLDTSMQALASGGVRVRVSRGVGGPDAAEAMAPTGDGTDLVEEVKDLVVGVAVYRANMKSLRAAADTEGVLLRAVSRDDDENRDGDDRR
jgi:flagellar hook-associated protein FlgK